MRRIPVNRIHVRSAALFVACAVLLVAPAGHAARAQRWQQATFADYAAGTAKGVQVGASGTVRLGSAIQDMADLGVQRIWSLLPSPDGGLFVGTGDDGMVLRVDGSGKVIWRFDSPEIGVHALLLGPSGRLYAGTAPGGLVYRIDPVTGEAETLCRTGSHYVWDLALNQQGDLCAATGEPGRVIVAEPGGDTRILYNAPEQHVMCLTSQGSSLLAGTAGGARIYALDSKADSVDVRLLYEAAQEEIHDLVTGSDGSMLASALPAADTEDSSGSSAALYRVTPSGAVEEIWRAPKARTLTLSTDASGRPHLATDKPARISRLDSVDREQILLQLDDGPVAAMHVTDYGKLILGGAQSGKLFAAGPGAAEQGEFFSVVRDFGTHSAWGRASWAGDFPAGTRVELTTRSGNSAEPDATWSDWSEPVDGSGDLVSSPPARFLQYRLRLTGAGGKAGPAVRRVVIYGQQSNLPPRIAELKVEPYRPRRRGSNANQDPAQAAIQRANEGRRPPQARTLFLIHWEASDPNGDELVYRLYFQGAGQESWKLANGGVTQTSMLWDTFTMPEGMSRLMLVASDAPDNSPSRALEARRISLPFAVDNSPPVVELQAIQQQGVLWIRAQMEDRTSPIVKAEYSVDYDDDRSWQIDPADGVLDSLREEAEFQIDGLAPGEHVIVVRAWDDLDNVGTAQIVIQIE